MRALPVIAMFVVLIAASGGAQAATYTNATANYHLTVPDGWDQTNDSGGNDATWEQPGYLFGGPTLSAAHKAAPNATNTAAYILGITEASHSQIKGMLGGTDVQAPHTFTTGGNRLAGEFILDYTLMSTTNRIRQVFFASDGYDMEYVLSITASPSDYANNSANWTSAINSWGLDNEPAPPAAQPPAGGGFLPGFEVAGAVAAVAVAGFLTVAVRGRRRP